MTIVTAPATPSSSSAPSSTYSPKGQRDQVFPSLPLPPTPKSLQKSSQRSLTTATLTTLPASISTKRHSFRNLPYHATPPVRSTATHLCIVSLTFLLATMMFFTFRAHLELLALQGNVLAAIEVSQQAARSMHAVDAAPSKALRHNVTKVVSQLQAPEGQQNQQQKRDKSDTHQHESNQTFVERNGDALQVSASKTYLVAHTVNATPSFPNLAAPITVAARPNSRKSTFTLHVGLHKTGTSFLQASLWQYVCCNV